MGGNSTEFETLSHSVVLAMRQNDSIHLTVMMGQGNTPQTGFFTVKGTQVEPRQLDATTNEYPALGPAQTWVSMQVV